MAATALPFTLALLIAPASTPPQQLEVHTVDVDSNNDAVQFIARDRNKDVTGEVVFWRDDIGRARLDVNFADGIYMNVIIDSEGMQITTDDAPTVAKRMLDIDAAMEAPAKLPQWMACAGSIALAGFACAPPIATAGAFVGCTGAATMAGCECLETITSGEQGCWD